MRRKILLVSTIVVLGLVGLTACGKKGASTEATTATEEKTEKTEATTTAEKKDTEKVSTVATEAQTEATTKATTEVTTATKEDESEKPKSASGVYNGFGDDNSIEVKLSNGSYKTFIVADESVANKLNDMEPGTKITFTYGPLSGQANEQILSVTAK